MGFGRDAKTKEGKLKVKLGIDKCKERGNSNRGNVGLADFLSEKDQTPTQTGKWKQDAENVMYA